jgi:hypothetical protein
MQEPKITKIKRVKCVVQMVEHLPSKWKVLSSNSSTTTKQTNKRLLWANGDLSLGGTLDRVDKMKDVSPS